LAGLCESVRRVFVCSFIISLFYFLVIYFASHLISLCLLSLFSHSSLSSLFSSIFSSLLLFSLPHSFSPSLSFSQAVVHNAALTSGRVPLELDDVAVHYSQMQVGVSAIDPLFPLSQINRIFSRAIFDHVDPLLHIIGIFASHF
jgi:hypothetical protein